MSILPRPTQSGFPSPVHRSFRRKMHEPGRWAGAIAALEPRRLFTAFVATVDNPFFPLIPGTTLTYEGTNEDGASLRHVASVLKHKKEVAGVQCTVERVFEYANGVLIEQTYDYYAQDVAGNVWYFGEDSTEVEDDIVTRAGSWLTGVDGAQPGMIMPANPAVGDSYAQERASGVAEDRAEVAAVDARVRTPAGAFAACLQTADTTTLDPEVLEHKFYARGVGLILAVGIAGDDEEVVTLTRVQRPSPVGLAPAPAGPSAFAATGIDRAVAIDPGTDTPDWYATGAPRLA